MIAADKFTELKAKFPEAELLTEGGNPVALIPSGKFTAGGALRSMALLLHPSQHSGYITRLFFEQRLEGVGRSQNWTEHTVLGRKWWAPSWKEVSPDQPWTSMLAAHLRAVT